MLKKFLKLIYFKGNDLQIISSIATVIVISSLVVTLTSIKETPLDFNDDEESEDSDSLRSNDSFEFIETKVDKTLNETSPLLSKFLNIFIKHLFIFEIYFVEF